ncbi:GNAT family N-acetyltransferase [Modestobacter sp. I12A-02628]|uniref:GNAT family N-acetyltransferase n=1 Tax=Goekera deserti TaxID=2497753 RepID=A0A7K3WHM2_9ACTN|nr:GNAT family N-acetyltransferase [Goekera deserti]MPQ99012.1 GNAT family N-acetyltransferase [Goekera deserti]NDI47346.1 GNAT family N-acetyltransferase [Goekera deserti]NEL55876.1 GNAT family N-acetyltransferase [Goekera deserti]
MELLHRTTTRLQLDAVVPGDLEAHHALLSDPATWTHLPSGRHRDRAQTAAGLQQVVDRWRHSGLDYWTARLRTDLPAGTVPAGLQPGAVVGTGGCALRSGTRWWNLYYRFTPAAWGHGLVAELVHTALDAARSVDPELPVIAYLLEHNVASRRRAERSGLTCVWRGPDAGNPDPDAVRLVYADRPLSEDLLDQIAATA